MLTDLGARVRVLNPRGGTFHAKVYLGQTARAIEAVVGSANLTGGLVTNIEFATQLAGTPKDAELRRIHDWAEDVWNNDLAVPWESTGKSEPEPLDRVLLDAIQQQVRKEPTFLTLGKGQPNLVREAGPGGLYIETDRSRERGTSPQLVPSWMLQIAWDYLRAHGELRNTYLLAEDGLNVKRSSAVCAILARLPGVEIKSVRPIVLSYDRR